MVLSQLPHKSHVLLISYELISSVLTNMLLVLFSFKMLLFMDLFFHFLFFYPGKEKESIPSDDVEDEDEQTKRHLNVVFIGHVGKRISLKALPLYRLDNSRTL